MDPPDLTANTPTVIVSLPQNDLSYAEAAIDAGADAVKVHLNATHRASGTTYGSLAAERAAIEDIIELGVPVGIVPGQDVDTVRDILPALDDIGVGFVDAFAHHLPPEARSVTGLQTWAAPTSDYADAEVRALASMDIDALELALFAKEAYGSPLSAREAARYIDLAETLPVPVVIPTQLALSPRDASYLADNGVTNFLLGSIVTGDTPEGVHDVTAGFVDALTGT